MEDTYNTLHVFDYVAGVSLQFGFVFRTAILLPKTAVPYIVDETDLAGDFFQQTLKLLVAIRLTTILDRINKLKIASLVMYH